MAEPTGIRTIICTLDEELHIERAVESALPLGSVTVVDSGSSDATVEVASGAGAEVVTHAWEGYSAQKNWALETFGGGSDWVLLLDADEYLTPELRSEIQRTVEAQPEEGIAAFMVARRYIFLGRELRHAWWYPDYQIRLVRPGRCTFEDRLVHEHPIVQGAVAPLECALVHENLKGLHAFIARHNRYSTLESMEIAARASRPVRGAKHQGWTARRRFVKERVWQRMPARGLLRFLWLYVVRRGFLDGRQGLIFCSLIAFYEAEIAFKVFERELDARAGAPSGADR